MTATTAPSSNTDTLNEDHDQLQSPRAMAEAAVAEAMAERERLKHTATTKDDTRGDVVPSTTRDRRGENHDIDNPDISTVHQEYSELPSAEDKDDDSNKLHDAWKQEDGVDFSNDKALETTLQLIHDQVDGLVRCGLEAFHGLESTTRHLEQTQQVAESTGHELERLKASEEQSRATISNLLRAVETSKSDTRDMSRVASVEARLRKESSCLRSERDEAMAEASESKRKCSLLQEEVRMVKAKLQRVTQEKLKTERDSRAAISLAKSLDSHASSDSDFYKRKVAELNDHLQSQQALVTEQKHQIDEMRRQMERSMSQNRLAHIRAESGRGKRGH